jgi:hypothetical protein
MTKTISLILLAIVLPVGTLAQPMGHDLFPLEIGNRWVYDYRATTSDPILEDAESDSGTATYHIVSKQVHSDSTIWGIREYRDGVHIDFWYPLGHSYRSQYPLKDTASFDLVEHHSGNHRIICRNTNFKAWQSVFYLNEEASDTGRFFRYHSAIDADTLGVIARWRYGGYELNVTFHEAIGISRVEFSNARAGSGPFRYTHHTLKAQTLVFVDLLDSDDQPTALILRPCFPNPFNPQTTISFSLGTQEKITLTIVDLLGRFVCGLWDGEATAGVHSLVWDATGLPSGMYFCIANTASATKCSKLILVR